VPGPSPDLRSAERGDLVAILEIYNHYVRNTATSFEVETVREEDRVEWFEEHSRQRRYRLLVAEDPQRRVVGWATSSRFRPRAAYDTTVETSVYCRPRYEGRGIGSAL
jgi:phosphinothricin acetyltransferase